MILIIISAPFCEKEAIPILSESLGMCDQDGIKGKVKQFTDTGQSIDAQVGDKLYDGSQQDILVPIHPKKEVQVGDELCFKVLPEFIAVIRNSA